MTTSRLYFYVCTALSAAFAGGSATLAYVAWLLMRSLWRTDGGHRRDILPCIGAVVAVVAARECFLYALEAWAFRRALRYAIDPRPPRPAVPRARVRKRQRKPPMVA